MIDIWPCLAAGRLSVCKCDESIKIGKKKNLRQSFKVSSSSLRAMPPEGHSRLYVYSQPRLTSNQINSHQTRCCAMPLPLPLPPRIATSAASVPRSGRARDQKGEGEAKGGSSGQGWHRQGRGAQVSRHDHPLRGMLQRAPRPICARCTLRCAPQQVPSCAPLLITRYHRAKCGMHSARCTVRKVPSRRSTRMLQ